MKKNVTNWEEIRLILRDKQLSLGITDMALAASVGLNNSTISRYWAGTMVPSAEVVCLLIGALDCEVSIVY